MDIAAEITAYDVGENAVNDARYSQASNLTPTLHSFVKFPPYFAEGIIGMTPKNAENFVKIWPPVSEKFFEIEIILFWAPFTGGPDAKILFLSARRPPTA